VVFFDLFIAKTEMSGEAPRTVLRGLTPYNNRVLAKYMAALIYQLD